MRGIEHQSVDSIKGQLASILEESKAAERGLREKLLSMANNYHQEKSENGKLVNEISRLSGSLGRIEQHFKVVDTERKTLRKENFSLQNLNAQLQMELAQLKASEELKIAEI
jgi:hypothetical protein